MVFLDQTEVLSNVEHPACKPNLKDFCIFKHSIIISSISNIYVRLETVCQKCHTLLFREFIFEVRFQCLDGKVLG